jgi:hypothetical protein
VLVTMRCVSPLATLRSQLLLTTIANQIAAAIRRGIGIVEYSIQDTHLHLIVEAPDNERLARGMQLLFSRIAFEVNRVIGRSGRLFRDRHHRQELTTPTQTRRALVYVLSNVSYCSTSLRSRNREIQLRRLSCGSFPNARTRLLRDAIEHIRLKHVGLLEDPGAARYGP